MGKDFWKGMTVGALAAILILGAGYAGYRHGFYGRDTVLSDPEHIQKLTYLEKMIDAYYLEEKDPEKLAEGLYSGLIYGLGDIYSRYYTAEEYAEETTATEGAYVGIGVSMQQLPEGGARIVEVYEGGPGKEAGLKPDDILSRVDGQDITELDVSEIVGMIKGSEAESVELTIHRENVEEDLKITVPISDVELPSVFHEMLDERTGYLHITEFKGVTYDQYMEAMEALKKEGMERLVIDLRGNPGGLLTSVCDILEEILPEGLIVYTEDKYGERVEYTCEGKNPLTIPLAVLVNESSASASEIFAGAVQDHEVGTIVGTATYGKGVVQSLTNLKDGSAVKLTVSKYYTPKGHHIHEVGITPDVEVKLSPALLAREEITREEDNQLQAAIEALDRQEDPKDSQKE